MPDRWRERVSFWVSVLSLVTGLGIILSAATGKLGVFVMGPPDLIAQVAHADSLRAKTTDSIIAARAAEGARIHARIDSVNAAQDAALRTFGQKIDMIVAVGCANFPRRDLGLSRLETACSSNLDRWREPGGHR